MDKEQSKLAYQEADTFYRVGQYEDALAILKKLAATHPNDRHILFPMARCLHKMNCISDAANVLDRIIQLENDYEPAKQFRQQIEREATAALDIPEVESSMSAAFTSPSGTSAPPTLPISSGPEYLTKALSVIIPVLFFIGLAYLHARWGEDFLAWQEQTATTGELTDIPTVPLIVYLLESLLIGFPVACFSGYISVLLVKRLPHGDFWPDMRDVALFVVYCSLLAFIPLIGWALIPYILYKHYDTSFVDLIIMAVVYLVLSAVLQFVLFFVVRFLSASIFGAI